MSNQSFIILVLEVLTVIEHEVLNIDKGSHSTTPVLYTKAFTSIDSCMLPSTLQ